MQKIKRGLLTITSVLLLALPLGSSLGFTTSSVATPDIEAGYEIELQGSLALYDESGNFLGYYEAPSSHDHAEDGRNPMWWWTDPEDCSHKWTYVTTYVNDPYSGRTAIFSNYLCNGCYTYKNSTWTFVRFK